MDKNGQRCRGLGAVKVRTLSLPHQDVLSLRRPVHRPMPANRLTQLLQDPSSLFYGLTQKQAERIWAWLEKAGMLDGPD